MLFLDESFDPNVESLLLKESDDSEKDDRDNLWDQFSSFVERKLRGYSTKEVDVFVAKAKKVNSEEKKRDLLSSIREAIKEANGSLSKADPEKKKELQSQLSILKQLQSKVSSYNPLKDGDNKDSNGKNDDDEDDRKKDVINLDDL